MATQFVLKLGRYWPWKTLSSYSASYPKWTLLFCGTVQFSVPGGILGLQPRDMAAMLLVNTIKFPAERDALVFTTNMAAVTSRKNQQ